MDKIGEKIKSFISADDYDDETEEMAPGYYRTLIDLLTDRGVEFIEPEFIRL